MHATCSFGKELERRNMEKIHKIRFSCQNALQKFRSIVKEAARREKESRKYLLNCARSLELQHCTAISTNFSSACTGKPKIRVFETQVKFRCLAAPPSSSQQ